VRISVPVIALRIVLLPTPLWPQNAVDTPSSTLASSAIPSPLVAWVKNTR